MEDFTERKLDPASSIGEELKRKREEKKLSLREVSRAVSIQPKYLQAIEEDRYDALPARVYAVNFLKSYARFLGLDEESMLKKFSQEAEVRASLVKKRVGNTEFIRPRVVITPTIIKRFIAAGIGIPILVYLLLQLLGVLRPPVIHLLYPSVVPFETEESGVMLRGRAERGSVLTVNGESVYIDEVGAFEKEVLLSEGTNTFELVAANRFNKTAVMQLKIKRFVSSHE